MSSIRDNKPPSVCVSVSQWKDQQIYALPEFTGKSDGDSDNKRNDLTYSPLSISNNHTWPYQHNRINKVTSNNSSPSPFKLNPEEDNPEIAILLTHSHGKGDQAN